MRPFFAHGAEPREVLHAPPKGFQAAAKNFFGARLVGGQEPSVVTARPASLHTSSQRAGLRYEDKVKAFLAVRFGSSFLPGPWFEWFEGGVRRRGQPDAVLPVVLRGDQKATNVIFECKAYHTPLAWWQLRKLYQPIVEEALERPTRVVEICNLYDSQLSLPEPAYLLQSFDDLTALREDAFYVLPWKPGDL